MDIEAIGKDILDCAYAIHSQFGSGLLEKAYRVILATELTRLGHKVVGISPVLISKNNDRPCFIG